MRERESKHKWRHCDYQERKSEDAKQLNKDAMLSPGEKEQEEGM